MTALLTDEEIAGSAWKWGRDQPSIHLPDLVVGFENGARFARSIYEARLAEEKVVRAGLVEALEEAERWLSQDGCDCFVAERGKCNHCLLIDKLRAALDAAKEIK